ncbi:hypothetical protein [Pseudomonas floridensis]|uniref:hypothetical protein n=1 Tax=Pseudomonas floridensis TaxID=1958950 RepID=UPI0009F34108|nr:hypothetical protein [Pseudomonas floridensis]
MQPIAKQPLPGLILLFVSLVASVLLLLLSAPERARAETGNQITCLSGVHTATWSPGLTNTAQRVDVSTKSHWGPCYSPSSDLGVLASAEQRFQATFSCRDLRNLASPITWEIRWDDQTTSLYTFNTTLQEMDNQDTAVVGVGYIEKGRYEGARAITVFVLGNLDSMSNNDCASPSGMSRLSGHSMLFISD